MNLTDMGTIKGLLGRHGFRFSKALGQNFLCDPDIPPAIAEGAGLTPGCGVLEVGPGIGTLTVELCQRARKVVAVELDRRLPPVLAETMGGFDNFTLVEGDILKTDIPALCRQHFPGAYLPLKTPAINDFPAIHSPENLPNEPNREESADSSRMVLHAAANLPYYITTPAVAALIDSGCFQSTTVMVQREVARRMCAAPGTSDYGAFTVYLNYHTAPRLILDVPRDCFIPAPNVDSAVVRLERLPAPPVETDPAKLFFVIKAAFSQRRKTLLNCLTAAVQGKMTKTELENLLLSCGLSANARGETLNLSEFAQIAEKLSI